MGLSDGADGGANGDGYNSGGSGRGRAVGDLGAAAGDGVDRGRVQGGGGHVGGDVGGSRLSWDGRGRRSDRGRLRDAAGGGSGSAASLGALGRRDAVGLGGHNGDAAGRSLDVAGGDGGSRDLGGGGRRGGRGRDNNGAAGAARGLDSGRARGGDHDGLGSGLVAGAARLGRDSGGLGSTVECDGVETEVAGLLGDGGLLGNDDGDVLSTTTLGVLDVGTGLLARSAVLARRAVGHAVVELQVAVELGGHLEAANGGLLDVLAVAAEVGGLLVVVVGNTADALVLEAEGAGGKLVTLGELVLAGEALPIESTVALERAGGEILPVETGDLLLGTLVVGVGRAVESRSASPATEALYDGLVYGYE